MKRFGLMAAVLMAALAGGAGSALAKPKILVLEAGEPVAPVHVSDPWEFGLGTIRLVVSDGTAVECRGKFGNDLEGTVLTNSAKTDIIAIKSGYLDLKGRLSSPCEETESGGLIRKSYLGVAPFEVGLRANGAVQTTGKAQITISYVSSPVSEPTSERFVEVCAYSAAKFEGAEVIEGPLSVTFGGLLKRTATSPKTCAKSVRFLDEGPAGDSDSPPGPEQNNYFYGVSAWVR